ncbi:glycerophosphodiester phosphodiesterase [Polycladidibacter stylochi]|uniref:glycerophosphodiester phosphodiesterase n=1 Tax=Polycladidibacter stylochi TaxID=1807766 RepID=UPI00082F9CDC|nr:glycerophosphodiester phosphodiesterase family protein [Pseudovibrio stylochi]
MTIQTLIEQSQNIKTDLSANNHMVRLKWHSARRFPQETPFTKQAIEIGLTLGASLEVDLRKHAEGGFAILHDATLESETSATGLVSTASKHKLKQNWLKDSSGEITEHPLLLLDDLQAIIAGSNVADGALIQLDLKTRNYELTERDIAGFAHAVDPIKNHIIISGEDDLAVSRLAMAVPGLEAGYDPCRDYSYLLDNSDGITQFVDSTQKSAQNASTIYLFYPFILLSLLWQDNLVKRFQDLGYKVDAWTLNSGNDNAEEDFFNLISAGVDQITTDEPFHFANVWQQEQLALDNSPLQFS